MNIDKVIFKIKDKQYNAVKCYGYKYLTKYIGKNLMVRSKYKFVEKSKIPTIVIEGQKGIEQDSAEWYYFFWEKRYFDFLAYSFKCYIFWSLLPQSKENCEQQQIISTT